MSKSAWERVHKLLREGREKSGDVFYILPETNPEFKSLIQAVYGEAVEKLLVDLARKQRIELKVRRGKR